MTHQKTEALLKKINYIEADVAIQRQILFAIPSDQRAELERTIKLIAAKNNEIEQLRQELRQHDPAEYQKILTLEDAVNEFKRIAADVPFQSIVGRNVHEACTLQLQNGKEEQCLIKACDQNNNWTIITLDGEIRQFPAAEVAEHPPKNDVF